jgi:hypothetical protein
MSATHPEVSGQPVLLAHEQLVENVEKLLEAGLVEWIGLGTPDVLSFLLTNQWICGGCGQKRHWFIARQDGVLCEQCDLVRRASASITGEVSS